MLLRPCATASRESSCGRATRPTAPVNIASTALPHESPRVDASRNSFWRSNRLPRPQTGVFLGCFRLRTRANQRAQRVTVEVLSDRLRLAVAAPRTRGEGIQDGTAPVELAVI